MSIETITTGRSMSPDELADVHAVSEAVAAGHPVDAEVARRIQERSAEARRRLLAARGVQNIGVEIIRELRGELPAA